MITIGRLCSRWYAAILLSSTFLAVQPGLLAQGISTGPELERSTTRSQYFKGLTKDSLPLISRLKISGISKQPDGSLTLRLLALDSDGNFVPLEKVASRISTRVICRSQSPITFSSDLESTSATPKHAGSSAYIAIDNSVMSGTLTRDVILGMKSALLGGAPLSDSIGVGSFNQSLTTLQRLGPAQRILENLSAEDLRQASGVSALYASAITASRELEQAGGVKSLIIVTTSGDNASAIWNSRDVARFLKDAGITAYVIRVGYDMASYPLRYIASYTGGCVYTVEEEEASTIGEIIREILYAQRWNSALTAQAGIEDVADCDSPWLRIELEGDSLQPAIADSIILTPREIQITTSPAVVALFDDQT